MPQLLEDFEQLIALEKWGDIENYWEVQYEDDKYVVESTEEVMHSTLQEDWAPEFEKRKI